MRNTLRRSILPGAALVAVLALAGCGSGSGIPDDASVADFCAATDTFAATSKVTEEAKAFSAGVKAARVLRKTGTPKSMPADARDGFELLVQIVTDAKDRSDLEKRYQKLTSTQKKSIDELDAYLTKTC